MDIKDLKYAQSLALYRSFSKAAAALFISQPALSQSIQRLESDIDVTLFLRDKTHVELTDAGHYFIDNSRLILENFDLFDKKIRSFSPSLKDTFTLGISQFYGRHLLSVLLESLAEDDLVHTPQIVEGESKFLENQIRQGNLDTGIFPEPIYSSGLLSFPLYREEIYLAINRNNTNAYQLAQQYANASDEVPLHYFAEYPFVLLKPKLKLRTLIDSICKEQYFLPKAIFETENLDTCLSLTESNYGISFLPSTVMDTYKGQSVIFFKIHSKQKFRLMLLVANETTAHRLKLHVIAEKLSERISQKRRILK